MCSRNHIIFAGSVHYMNANKSDQFDFYVPALLTLADVLRVYHLC